VIDDTTPSNVSKNNHNKQMKQIATAPWPLTSAATGSYTSASAGRVEARQTFARSPAHCIVTVMSRNKTEPRATGHLLQRSTELLPLATVLGKQPRHIMSENTEEAHAISGDVTCNQLLQAAQPSPDKRAVELDIAQYSSYVSSVTLVVCGSGGRYRQI